MAGYASRCPRTPDPGRQQVAYIPTRGPLVDSQVERRGHRQQMVEDISLDRLVVAPLLVSAEHIDLDW